MKIKFLLPIAVLTIVALLATCGAGSTGPGPSAPRTTSADFNAYWYQGKAELNHYALTQARYGELRKGDAVMVFVTEDFLTKEHVKYEGIGDGERTNVLKLNWIERFNTGLYDYSLMTSVFSPVDGTPALKHTLSVQDWCGQVWVQTNRRNEGYTMEGRSYFQQEGDATTTIGDVWLEDAVWNQLRLDPKKAPLGALRMLPSARYLRLIHKPMEAVDVTASLSSAGDTSAYTMAFASLDRSVTIRFRTAFPHTVFGWSESRMDGFGADAQRLTTEARLTHQLMEPYWSLHDNVHDSLRTRFGLSRMEPLR